MWEKTKQKRHPRCLVPESGDFDILNEFPDRLCSGGYLRVS